MEEGREMRPRMPGWLVVARVLMVGAFMALGSASAGAEGFIVKEGQPCAEIIISEQPSRSVRLAAHDLRLYVEKITGARLAIVTQPSAGALARVYVGRSSHTDKLNVTAEGLKDGAYRMVSGKDWLVLIGDDRDFTPIEPWTRNRGDIPKVQSAWQEIVGAPYGQPDASMFKNLLRLPGYWGAPEGAATQGEAQPLVIWTFDERGSYNAVCGLLRKFGVRWYMPGELGEVLPVTKTLPLPDINETTLPDFAIRRVNIRLGVHGIENAMWALRLGLRDPFGVQVAHGLATMTNLDEVYAAHPDWFALYGGKRLYKSNYSKNQLCYSNEELFRETLRYARAQFDHFKYEAVSVMPPDGYSAICQCDLCNGKETQGVNDRGRLSDHVWDFVNRVAREIAKTHPDRKILNCAYGVYTLPPQKIAKLEPNVVVSIVGGRRPMNNKPEQQEECRKLREGWLAKTSNPIIIFENYPLTDRGWYLPAYTPHSLGESVNATKGVSQGEDIWLNVRPDSDKTAIGFNHFMVYFTASMYWGGKQQDVDAMFREYCRLFYGPAEQEIHAFFTFCEQNWQEMEKDKTKAEAALALFEAAKAKADPGSVHGKRLALIDEYLKGLRNKCAQLAQKRGPLPVLRLVGEPREKIVIDGKLDEKAWTDCPSCSMGRLRELQTGRQPVFGTTVKAAWQGSNLYFGIRCEERPGEKLNIATTKKEDQAMWYGDAIEIEIETDSRSYYQIALNPSGALIDLDRGAPRGTWFGWDSQAEVATSVADDHWTAEIRIPVTQDENDPLNRVIGRKPTQSLPWHINICRQRIRDNGSEHSALSPTGVDNYHKPMKFAYFYDGRSHQFEADATVTDYVIASQAAAGLAAQRKLAEAVEAYRALAQEKVTSFQKAVALEQAAAAAMAMSDYAAAKEIAALIPIEPVKKTVLMRALLAQNKAAELVAEFGGEDFGAWPFWQAGEGLLARGRAYAALRSGKEAEADLSSALPLIADPRARHSALMLLADNRERTLKDDAAALAAFRSVFEASAQVGTASELGALQGAARILVRQGKFDDALATLKKANVEKMRGTWRHSMLLSIGDTQAAAGRKDEALAAYKEVAADAEAAPNMRKAAEEQIKALEGK